MRLKTQKSLSKFVGIWTFLLLLILKGAFPKPAVALTGSSLDSCALQPACRAALGSELAPAVTAPTGAGFGASTLSTTTATGATSTYVKAAAGVAVVTAGVLTPESTANDANIARWHYWSQAINSRAQVLAKQRYCAAYPQDTVCTPFIGAQGEKVLYEVRGIYTVKYTRPQDNENYTIERTETFSGRVIQVWGEIGAFRMALETDSQGYQYPTLYILSRGIFNHYNDSESGPVNLLPYPINPQPGEYKEYAHGFGQWASFYRITDYNYTPSSITRYDNQPDTDGNPPPLPWEQWPQEKRNLAVGLLTDSDWQSLIPSMPEGGRLRPGETVNAQTNIIPGQSEDDPNTPEDERLPTKASGSYTSPDPDPNSPPPSPEPEPDAEGGGAMEGGGYTSDRGSSAYSSLVNELRNSGIRFTEANIVYIGRDQTGKIVWLEIGNNTAGLQHILNNHKTDFENVGISENQIPDAVMRAVTTGRIVGYQGTGQGRPIYEITFNGQTQYIAVTVGSNGFIVGANPNPQ